MPDHTPVPPQLDPRAPLVLDTRDLPRRPGSLRTVSRTVPAPVDLALPQAWVPPGTDLSLDLRLESVTEGVLVTGTAAAATGGECVRCLRPVAGTVHARVQELYAYAASTTEETTEEDEVGRLYGDLLDLEPALRDAIVLALPSHPRCRPDCPGLCPGCGVPWDDLPADHDHRAPDSRWAALNTLLRRDGENTVSFTDEGNP